MAVGIQKKREEKRKVEFNSEHLTLVGNEP
jgi:hypothetical protein